MTRAQLVNKKNQSAPGGPAESTNFLSGFSIYLPHDVDVNSHDRNVLAENIAKSGGVLCDAYPKEILCGQGVVVLDHRAGDDFIRAMKDQCIVGSLKWLREILHRQEFVDPMSRLLYYVRITRPALIYI